MATATDICNYALLKIGEKRITTAGFGTPTNERERLCSENYERLRDAELRKNLWNFAIKWDSLSVDATEPDNPNYTQRYAVPADCLRIIEIDETKDYRIESGYIVCNVDDEINLRYVRRVTVVNDMDDLFRDALGCRIAAELCDRLTQKRAKRADVIAEYTAFMLQAANTDAIEEPAQDLPESDFITCRV